MYILLERRDIIKNNLSKNLKKLRKEEGLSQEQLADLLSVSRQSVSKWETADAYPEMDKILYLCKEFNLDINDLLNGDIYEVKQKNDSIKEIHKTINKIIDFFVDSFTLFFKMSLKSKIKFIFELSFLILILLFIFYIIGQLLGTITGKLLYSIFPLKAGMIIQRLLLFIYNTLVIVLSLIIVAEITKNRYLKYYNNKEIDTNQEDTTIKVKSQDKKIVIRDPEDSGYKISQLLLKIIVIFLKALFIFILIPLIILLLILSFGLISSFLVYKTGFFFIGILIIILSSLVILSFIILLSANFIFNRKNNYKVFIYTTLISILMIGFGSGLVFIGTLSFDITNEYDKEIYKIKENTIEMNENLIIQDYNIVNDIQYIEENIDNIKIEYEYNSLLCPSGNNYYTEIVDSANKQYIYFNCYPDNFTKFIRSNLMYINEKKIISFSNKIYNLKIYGSKENLKIIKDNINK